MIGGLLDNRDTEAYSKIPWLSDIPILGKLFKSEQITKTNTELIVIVTPELVAPLPANAAMPELKYPTKFLPTNSGIPMSQPDGKTAENTMGPLAPSMPVEQLIQANQPEKPLVITTGGVGFGQSSGTGATSTGPAPPVAAPAAPQ
jgi:pilus assembly protein CpaC